MLISKHVEGHLAAAVVGCRSVTTTAGPLQSSVWSRMIVILRITLVSSCHGPSNYSPVRIIHCAEFSSSVEGLIQVSDFALGCW